MLHHHSYSLWPYSHAINKQSDCALCTHIKPHTHIGTRSCQTCTTSGHSLRQVKKCEWASGISHHLHTHTHSSARQPVCQATSQPSLLSHAFNVTATLMHWISVHSANAALRKPTGCTWLAGRRLRLPQCKGSHCLRAVSARPLSDAALRLRCQNS